MNKVDIEVILTMLDTYDGEFVMDDIERKAFNSFKQATAFLF